MPVAPGCACNRHVRGTSTGRSDPSSTPCASLPSGGSGSGGSDQDGSDQVGGQDSAGKSTAPGAGSPANGKAATCRTDELEITAKDDTIDGDRDGTVAVQLKNRSGRTCTISGYAGVDLKTNAGSLSAERKGPGERCRIAFPARGAAGSTAGYRPL
ncbi:DUF4232 domain-containing protein [Streptomyces syringium]|uniref:DUF4232 domain-containing protein n=1 Tax=Streptomyces syringium TaxID=76729 RepID=UPI003454043E